MKPTLRIYLAMIGLALALTLGSCASSDGDSDKPGKGDATEKAATAENFVAGQDYALINFMRPSIMAFAITFSLWDGDQAIGILTPMHIVQYKATPGEHIFMVRSENWGVVKAKVAAGKTYYITCEPRMGMMKAQVAVDVVRQNDPRLAKYQSDLKIRGDVEEERNRLDKNGSNAAAKAVQNVNDGKAPFVTMTIEDGR